MSYRQSIAFFFNYTKHELFKHVVNHAKYEHCFRIPPARGFDTNSGVILSCSFVRDSVISQPRGPTRATCSVESNATPTCPIAAVDAGRLRKYHDDTPPSSQRANAVGFDLIWKRFISSVGVHPRIFRSKTLQTIVAI